MSQVRLEKVTKSFGDQQVIPPLDLSISDREFVVLVGPSGCGKTTTLRMIAGLESVTSGTVYFREKDVTGVRPGLRNCSMVFQNYALYPHMTVAENIGYGMKVRGTPKAEVALAVAEAARILNLADYLERKPNALSGGQRQRVAIGRAIVRQPHVFLFDEPLSNLDAKLRIEMRTEIKLMHRRLNTTSIYVTHDQVEAMTMADRVVVMNQGRIEQAADPITLYEKPDNLFVAAFIGAPSMNFIEGSLARGDGGLAFRAGGDVNIRIPDQRAERLSAALGQPVVLGVRPEHTMTDDPAFPTIPLQVADIEPLGPHTLLIGQAGNAPFIAQAEVTTRVKPDDIFSAPVNPDKMHFFLKNSGERIS